MSWPIGLFIVSAGGWFLIGMFMHFLRRACLNTIIPWRDSFRAIDLCVGTTERLVAVVLLTNHSSYLPVFIGGWMTLKFAAHWQRESAKTRQVSEQSLLALVGGVVSFTLAIYVGTEIDPTAMAWLKTLG